jgi:Ca-activated chloride channel family protein
VQESQVQLYTIGYFNRAEAAMYAREGDQIVFGNGAKLKVIDNPLSVFRRLARESGAEAFFPGTEQELAAAAERISDELRTQYTIAYYPSNPARDGSYRRIKVTVKAKSGLKVRAREGYLAPR